MRSIPRHVVGTRLLDGRYSVLWPDHSCVEGSSVVLDGVARAPEIEHCRMVANEEGALFVVILTECSDPEVHRSRIEGRDREIPNWYELDWEHVQESRARWEPPEKVDVTLQATDGLQTNRERLTSFLSEAQASPTLDTH